MNVTVNPSGYDGEWYIAVEGVLILGGLSLSAHQERRVRAVTLERSAAGLVVEFAGYTRRAPNFTDARVDTVKMTFIV